MARALALTTAVRRRCSTPRSTVATRQPALHFASISVSAFAFALAVAVAVTVASAPASAAAAASQPHIVVIVADDMGFNDVSFHGGDQIPTPNIDALAYSGIILNRHYVQPVCTPTRAAFMTSKYPIRMGLQGSPLVPGEIRSMPPGKILPEYLRDLGYATHGIGKWHLGFYNASLTPMHRGFDSHVGYWNGLISYYDHLMGFPSTPALPRGMYGYDMRVNMSTAWELRGRYATEVFTERAEEVISQHDPRRPLFMYMAHLAVHAGNTGQLVEAPRELIDRFAYIQNPNRRAYAAMVTYLDMSVGRVVNALQEKGMLENTLILFMTDNGSPTFGIYQNFGSNYPLRGIKDTFWEGGVRGVAAIWGKMLPQRGSVSTHVVHVTDWLPTFYTAAGGDLKDLVQPMDGVNQLEWLTGNISSIRNATLINIDEVHNTSAFILDNWKLVQGLKSTEFNDYYGDSGNQKMAPRLHADSVWGSDAGRAFALVLGKDSLPEQSKMQELRQEATITCNRTGSSCSIAGPEQYCLFDIVNDPCELKDMADENPEIAQKILELIQEYSKKLVPQTANMDLASADPQLWGDTWTTWVTCKESPDLYWCNTSPPYLSS